MIQSFTRKIPITKPKYEVSVRMVVCVVRVFVVCISLGSCLDDCLPLESDCRLGRQCVVLEMHSSLCCLICKPLSTVTSMQCKLSASHAILLFPGSIWEVMGNFFGKGHHAQTLMFGFVSAYPSSLSS